jgi:hypothetical protein
MRLGCLNPAQRAQGLQLRRIATTWAQVSVLAQCLAVLQALQDASQRLIQALNLLVSEESCAVVSDFVALDYSELVFGSVPCLAT